MPELSIIVPVFNVERFLPRCIESILAQDYTDYELILINDGSTDLSGKVIGRYESLDDRIIVFEQPHKGVSSARNKGLEVASGKYVSFIDADDWIESTMFSTLIGLMKRNCIELVCCNWIRNYMNGVEEQHVIPLINGIMTAEKFVYHMFDIPRTIGESNWNKIFIMEKIRHYYDETIHLCEDSMFLLQYCIGIQNVYFLNEAFYHYCERSDSLSNNKNNYDYLHKLNTKRKLVSIAKSFRSDVGQAAESDYLDQCYLYFNLDRIGPSVKSQIKVLLKTYIRENIINVIFNSCIYWKLKVLYILKFL